MNSTRTNRPDLDENYIRPGEAARRLFTTPNTIRRMAERGEIRAITYASGHHRYLESDIEAMRPKAVAS